MTGDFMLRKYSEDKVAMTEAEFGCEDFHNSVVSTIVSATARNPRSASFRENRL